MIIKIVRYGMNRPIYFVEKLVVGKSKKGVLMETIKKNFGSIGFKLLILTIIFTVTNIECRKKHKKCLPCEIFNQTATETNELVFNFSNPVFRPLQLLVYGNDVADFGAKGSLLNFKVGNSNEPMVAFDFFGNFGAAGLGHSNPKIIETIRCIQDNGFDLKGTVLGPFYATLAQKLSQLAPGRLANNSRVLFYNSGSEGTEAALVCARGVAGTNSAIISVKNAVDGHGGGARSVNQPYQPGLAPFVGNFESQGCPTSPNLDFQVPFDASAATAVQNLITTYGNIFAAIIVEPVQCIGSGCTPAPDGMLQGLRAVCDANGILLIFDEWQCGSGRSGFLTAAESFGPGADPDILLMGSSLSGSEYPISAIIFNKTANVHGVGPSVDLAAVAAAQGLDFTSTFGYGNIACGVALKSLDLIQCLLPNVREVGSFLMEQLQEVKNDFPALIVDVRGKGLMIGVEFASEATFFAVAQKLINFSSLPFGSKIKCKGGAFGEPNKHICVDGFAVSIAHNDVSSPTDIFEFPVMRLQPAYFIAIDQAKCFIETLRTVLQHI